LAEAPWPEGAVADALAAGAPDDDPCEVDATRVVDGVEPLDGPACGEDAQADRASTAPRPSTAETRCVVRVEQTRGTGRLWTLAL
jgi:hypothetical protein